MRSDIILDALGNFGLTLFMLSGVCILAACLAMCADMIFNLEADRSIFVPMGLGLMFFLFGLVAFIPPLVIGTH